VAPGELHGLIGPNGAGKTSLIRCLLGGLPHQGCIDFHFRGSGVIGYVPQHLAFDQAAPLTVGDFLALMLQRRALPFGRSRKLRRRINELLAMHGVEHLAGRRMGSLSGGELQRVLLAQAMRPVPELLLLDEPASHIDEKGAREFEQQLQDFCRRDGITVLMVGHHLSRMLQICNRVSVLDRELVYSGDPRTFAATKECERLFGFRQRADRSRQSPRPLAVGKAG